MSAEFNNKLNKGFILKNKSEIEELFKKGIRLNSDMLKAIWTVDISDKSGVFVFFSVPKRLIPKAHNRNLIKRRMKEALRQNLSLLKKVSKQNNLCIRIAVVYSSDKIHDYQEIENKIILSLQSVFSKISNS
ncbi:MAG: ribonuclease P protein component [Marinilabiliales bacterium]|nr:MAG: ribonuclease P protein component [Marinilabiliales bacterium]